MVTMVLAGLVKLHVVLRGQPEKPADSLIEAVYRVERYLCHNNWLYQQLINNPRFMKLQDYLGCFTEIG